MKWLKLAAKFIDVKEVAQFFISFLYEQAKKSDNTLDNQAVEKIEKVLIESGILDRL